MIFGSQEDVLQEMSRHLRGKQCTVDFVQEEGKIMARINSFKPDVILLQLNSEVKLPIDQWVAELIKNKVAARIIIFKAKEMRSVSFSTDIFVKRCYDNGASGYIGEYSSASFISQLETSLAGQALSKV